MKDFQVKNSFGFALKSIIYVILLCVLVWLTNKILMPKKYYDETYQITSTYQGFYQMDKNSIDVIFLGSSHAISFFSPQELYNNYGIKSYNLSSEQQSILVSYYWLREALRYQKPTAVVLDTYVMFPYYSESPLNSAEATVRMAMDNMRFSRVKREAVKAICENDPKQRALSYYLTNIRFHQRWRELSERDLTFMELDKGYELKGFAALGACCWDSDYAPFSPDNSAGREKFVPLMLEYLDKIADLCEENDIELILTKTPSSIATREKYNTVKDYADNRGLRYIDFNCEDIYREIEYNFPTDNYDSGGHGNIWGATKVTNYMGRLIKSEIPIDDTANEQWEKTRSFYDIAINDCTLPYINDCAGYIRALNHEQYAVFIAVDGDAYDNLNDDIRSALRELGLKKSDGICDMGCYYAVIDAKEVISEEVNDGMEELETYGTLQNGRLPYNVKSAGYKIYAIGNIYLDGIEYSQNGRGINIVVYNKEKRRVVDSVAFDTHSEELTCTRTNR